jgi:hypothetical protein
MLLAGRVFNGSKSPGSIMPSLANSLRVMALLALAYLMAAPPAAAQKHKPSIIKVKIDVMLDRQLGYLFTTKQAIPAISSKSWVPSDSDDRNRNLLLSKLNKHCDKGLSFQNVAEGFDYRIVFSSGFDGLLTWHSANAVVFDAGGSELFRTYQTNRMTDASATDWVAKDIIKRLRRRSVSVPSTTSSPSSN